jgi:soluble lytic murein transglycosylase
MKRRKFAGGEGRDQAKLPDVEGYHRGVHRRALVWLLASALAVIGTADALSAARHKHVSPHRKKAVEVEHHKHVIKQPAAGDAAAAPLPPVLAAAKQAIELVRRGKAKDATALAASIGDPVAAKLVEWTLLRHFDGSAGFDRYVAFIRANPDWPSMPQLRRRAEARLWQERRDSATVRRFVGEEPTSAIGRLALARVEMGEGDHADAESKVRAVWQSAQLSAELETAVLAAFPNVLTRADHVSRMHRRIGAKDFGSAMRAAKRVGDDQIAIVKACTAAEAKSAKGGALLDAVRAAAREDLGYALCRLHWLLRNDTPGSNLRGRIATPKEDIAAAVKLTLAASQEDLQRQDTDEWWRERRALARKLIDLDDAATAYQVVRDSAPPANPYYRAEFHFMAGWIALRFLDAPTKALKHFAHVDDGMTDPITLARAAYWRGRAAEAAGQVEEMHAQYEAAAGYPTAYYGQLARARLGLDDIVLLRPPPEPVDANANELLHAADILYEIGEGDLVLSFVSDLAEESSDHAVLAGLGRLTAHYNDAQAMLLVGKTALARGLPMDLYAFPDVGVPNYHPVGSQLDRCIVYAIVRTESGFDQDDISSAKAVGLMQVTPGAGRDTAKRFGVAYDWKRLVSDSAYNTQMGAAEVSALLKDYRGSFILTFAGYNAGRGRVEQWVARHGDPRDPKIDAVDWVERIPFAETRNYVERVMENLQVYRKRFGDITATIEPNLHRAATVEWRPKPAAVEQRPVPTTVELSIPH